MPRSVTVALALPIAQQLDAPLSITAAAVLLQGILVRPRRPLARSGGPGRVAFVVLLRCELPV